jgi:hypothetical protein
MAPGPKWALGSDLSCLWPSDLRLVAHVDADDAAASPLLA